MYHSKVVSNEILNDITSAVSFTNLPGVTDSWTFYGDSLYGAGTYQAEGYYLSSYIDFYVYDTETLQQLLVTADTADCTVYYRSSNSLTELQNNTVDFTEAGATVVGTKTFTLADIKDRWFQFAIVFRTGTWGTGTIESVQVRYMQSAEFFSQGEFLMDDPGFEESISGYSATFTARDDMKKAFEAEVTLPDYSSLTDVAVIIRDTALRAGIPYTTSTIPLTTYEVKIAKGDNWKNIRAIDILSEVMLYLTSKNVLYRLQMIDGNFTLSLVTVPTTSVDWQLHYKYNTLRLSKKYEANKVLQRVTVLSYDHITDPEEQLVTDTLTDETDTLSWTKDSMFLRVATSGTGTVTVDNIDLEAKEITLTVTGTLDVTVYGCPLLEGFDIGSMSTQVTKTDKTSKKIGDLPPNSVVIDVKAQVTEAFNSSGTDHLDIGITGTANYFADNIDVSSVGVPTVTRTAGSFGVVSASEGKEIYAVYIPGVDDATTGAAYVTVNYVRLARYKGEAIYQPNAREEGFTNKIINRLVQSDAEAEALAENVLSQYGAPKYQIEAELPCNPLLEVGDNILVWSKNSNTKNIFRIDDITISWQAEGASMMQNLTLTDTGVAFSAFNWDDDGLWDAGDLWDQDLGTATSDTDTYYSPITFS
jgi:hypothetical protein